ncbi:MAG: hypothetical protein HY651_03095 [Acidobacteria bacterium]|nr:hypothetical protein [Acidobacteriota bacterium]
MQSFSFEARGRKYTVKTEALGTAFSMSGHWLYEPSVILPCALTGNKYVLLIARNKNSTHGQEEGEVITARTSTGPDNFASETTILDNSNVDNICDMIDARPIWDGSQWHIYVQAVPGTIAFPCSSSVNNIYEAVGSSLNPPGAFEWVKVPGTNNAKAIISGTSGASGDKPGIGELMQ